MDRWDPHCYHGSPILSQLEHFLSRFGGGSDWPALQDYNQLSGEHCLNFQKLPLQCVQPNESQRFREQYEPRVYLAGQLPTREQNWHDFFNWLVWQQFPKSKAAINRLHYQSQLNRFGVSNQRTHLENYLTLFDENGVVVVCQNSQLNQMLREHRWVELFYENRESVIQEMRFYVFGHALFEKALNPYIGMTAKAIIFDACVDDIDTCLSDYFLGNAKILMPKMLHPVPILGVPNWYDEVQDLQFYQNQKYFRVSRVRTP